MLVKKIANTVKLIASDTIDEFVSYEILNSYLCFTAVSDSYIGIDNIGSNSPIIYYSTDGENFTLWDYSNIILHTGDTVYMYGDNTKGFSESSEKYSRFTMGSGKIISSGDVQALLSIEHTDTIPCSYCFYGLFEDCTSLIEAPVLSSTHLTRGCYIHMFSGCTSLVNTPELPATSLVYGCYANMFNGCTSLVNAPELPATNLSNICYSYMFYGCTSLVTAPELPATELKTYCYSHMFTGCSKLNYIKALFTTEPNDTYTEGWVDGVSSIGTFIKNIEATWDVVAINGIPEGWTITLE